MLPVTGDSWSFSAGLLSLSLQDTHLRNTHFSSNASTQFSFCHITLFSELVLKTKLKFIPCQGKSDKDWKKRQKAAWLFFAMIPLFPKMAKSGVNLMKVKVEKWKWKSESGKVEITKSHLAKNEANLVNRKLKKRNEKKFAMISPSPRLPVDKKWIQSWDSQWKLDQVDIWNFGQALEGPSWLISFEK